MLLLQMSWLRLSLAYSTRLLGLVFAAAALSLSGGGAAADMKQAPASRIALDLPDSYEPSALFSGFTNEALGVSLVIVEMPEKAYEELEAGMTPETLAAKGILNARPAKLARATPHVYMQAEQTSPAGRFAKFFVAFRDGPITALITANVQKASLENGQIKVADIEAILASARVTETAGAARELFRLGNLGAFKPAGQFLGTARIYTLDGRSGPGERAVGRPMLIAAPSLDRRPVPKPEEYAASLVNGLPGLTDVAILEQRRVMIAGLAGIEMTGRAMDRDGTGEVAIYHLLLVAPSGGYYRVVGQVAAAERERYLPEFRRIAHGFEVLP